MRQPVGTGNTHGFVEILKIERGKTMKLKKKILIPVIALAVILIAVLVYLFSIGAFKSKIQKFEDDPIMQHPENLTHAWEYYENEFQGTRDEDRARKVILNVLEETIECGHVVFRLITHTPDYLDDFVNFLQQFQKDDPLYDRANAALTAYQGMLDLSEALTDPFDIYASPSAYYGKTVTLIGEIGSNDVRRRMLHIDVGDFRYLEVSYEYAGVISTVMKEDPPEKGADEWLRVEGGYIVAKGVVKQYTDSTNAFLATTRISELGDCNWEAISNYID